ncbi:MAG: gamma-glutamylcyclotransferase family protein [Solirubrobacteraceae bacterium]
MTSRQADFVFAYGSLVPASAPLVRELRGWRRRLGVAMDNSRLVPGYKVFSAPDGTCPDVCVAFLDVEPCAGAAVNGVCLPVTARRLAALDRRERNYARFEVTEAVDDPPGRVWTYVGRAESRARLREAERAVVQAAYLRGVERAFAALGQLERFRATTLPHGLEVVELRRVDLPES